VANVERTPEMTAKDVCEFLSLIDRLGVRIWLDGGWAVDACLGSQTRRHEDLDIVIEGRDVPAVLAALEKLRFRPVPRPDTSAWNFVMGDDGGHQVDFHVIVVDEHGRGSYGPPTSSDYYPAEALAGAGAINGRTVKCITPEWLVRFHTGYDVNETDWADVSALCQRFSIPIPEDFAKFL
jgi:lincosamide nucleotidyltransferase A/C/D/E